MREKLYILARGIGQVMFQENALSGMLMWVGLACGAWSSAVLALWGSAVGTLTALWAGYSKEDIRRGLYGFNGALVGIAVGVFFSLNTWTLWLATAGAALSSVLYRWWPCRRVLPPFTAPFIVVVWMLLVLSRYATPGMLLSVSSAGLQDEADLFGAFCRHIGQVMFQEKTVWSGLFFLAGIAVNAPRQALYAVGGALLPLLFVRIEGADYADFNAGLYGYNAVLCALALCGGMRSDVLWTVFSVLLSIGLQRAGMLCGCVTLTAPFVLSVWISRLLRNAYAHARM